MFTGLPWDAACTDVAVIVKPAATINAAYAMGLSDSHGSITIGKKANLIITKEVPSYGYLPYAFGSNLIDQVILNGKVI